MQKITVLDKCDQYHSFKGDDKSFTTSSKGCVIFHTFEEQASCIAHFKDYEWVKITEVEDEKPCQGRKSEFISFDEASNLPMDIFTQADIETRDGDKPDFNTLKDGEPIDMEEAPQEAVEEVEDDNVIITPAPKKKPLCETCDGAGTVPNPDPDNTDPLDTVMCADC